jgi:RHS repeat-associated protein
LTDGPGYTGHVVDAATGLVYMQQRYCDPMVGRCLSVDPVTAYNNGDMRFFNRYAYAFNNPYAFKDPDGRCPNCVTGGIGAAIGLVIGLGAEGYRQFKSGEFDGRALAVEGGKGALVGGLIGLTGGAAAASGLTLSAQAAATSSVALGVGAGANAVGEVAKGNPAPPAAQSMAVGYATAAGAVAGTAMSPVAKSMTTTVIPAVASNPVTSLSGKVFNTVNIPAQTIERPAAAEVANNLAGSVVEDVAKRRLEQDK